MLSLVLETKSLRREVLELAISQAMEVLKQMRDKGHEKVVFLRDSYANLTAIIKSGKT